MCRHRLGQTEPARTALDKALKWRAALTRITPEFAAEFQAALQESMSVLDATLPDLPADAFSR